MTHIYNNWIPDRVDTRDHLFASAPISTPEIVDLSPKCSAVEDQEALGSCTGQAIVGIIEYYENIKKNKYTDLSRLFVYYNERVMIGTINEDSGANIRDGIKSIADLGVCVESLCKYDITKFTKKPTNTAYKRALSRKISSYRRLSTIDDMINCIASGSPFVFGFTVYQSFETRAVASTGVMTMPATNDPILGGHAVTAVGYDKTKRLVKVRNSWGTGWGDKGYFYMPFDYISNPELASDFWTITL